MTDRQQPYTGDPCARPSCDGTLVVYDSKPVDGSTLRVRYFRCNRCGARPVNNKRVETDPRLERQRVY